MPYYLNSIGDENTSEVDDFNQILKTTKILSLSNSQQRGVVHAIKSRIMWMQK